MLTVLIAAVLAGAAARDDFDPDRCQVPRERGAVILSIVGEPKVKAGETVAVKPRYTSNPGAFDDLPLKCFSGWQVSDAKTAKLSRDRRSVIVAADAKAGGSFTVSAVFLGRRISQTYTVIVPVRSPIVGFWTQEGVSACPEATRVFDLVFERSGDFAVSFGPSMHGNKDYQGKWRVDGKRLILSDVTGRKPSDFVGEAVFDVGTDGILTFETAWLGTQGERGRCVSPFRLMR